MTIMRRISVRHTLKKVAMSRTKAFIAKNLPYVFKFDKDEGEFISSVLLLLLLRRSLRLMNAILGLIIENEDDLSCIMKKRCPIRIGKFASNENNTTELMVHLNERLPVKHLHLPLNK
jgi:hypothetical protein